MKTIMLTNDRVAIVDNEDYENISKRKWYSSPMGYARRAGYIGGKETTILMHRQIMLARKGEVVDHINGNTLDNRKSNLRICTQSENTKNRKLSKRNKTGYYGVCKMGDKWRARIGVNNKLVHIGLYLTPREAALAYNKFAQSIAPDFYRMNVIE